MSGTGTSRHSRPKRYFYPFGFGLSYTTFSREKILFEKCDGGFCFRVLIRNTGNVPGKEVIQIYLEAPQGLLGKPAKTPAAFLETKELMPGEEEVLNLFVEDNALASFDDAGVTGYKSAYVLEKPVPIYSTSVTVLKILT